MEFPKVVVGAAILRSSDRGTEVLAAERMGPAEMAGGWEFVGGKVEPGETDVGALIRECREELDVDIVVGDRVGDDALLSGGDAILRVWTARITSGEPRSNEHSALRWLTAAELYDVAWLPADLPIVSALLALL